MSVWVRINRVEKKPILFRKDLKRENKKKIIYQNTDLNIGYHNFVVDIVIEKNNL